MTGRLLAAALVLLALMGCGPAGEKESQKISVVPRGYVDFLEVEVEGRLYGFGPFVGYYFRPEKPGSLERVAFICNNERSYYTKDLPEGARLFRGSGVLTRLPDMGLEPPGQAPRIRPVFFPQAPKEWLATRPAPQDEYPHFHSLHDRGGPAYIGYWLRHVAETDFTYDMGGRVGPSSPLYHKVKKGVDRDFPRIVEFDKGADK
jgi:hypothetical protein